MTRTIAFDTEAYYGDGCSIGENGTYHYLRHPLSDHFMMSVYDGQEAWVGHPKDFNFESFRGQHLVMHHSAYDTQVLDRYKELGYAPKDLSYSDDCTADLAAYHQSKRSLDAASASMLGKPLSKSVRNRMKNKRFAELKPAKQAEFIEYSKQDAIACYELWHKWNTTWPEKEKRLSRLTRKLNRKGVRVDAEAARKALALLQEKREEAGKHIPWEKKLSLPMLDSYCKLKGIPTPESTDEDSIEFELWAEQFSQEHPIVDWMRKWRKANTYIGKLEIMCNQIRPDGKMHIELKYGGAEQTLRWGGSGGFNVHNLPKGEYEGVNIRHYLLADEGCLFFDNDFNAIEPRCLAWLCGNEAMLGELRQGLEVYAAFALATGQYDGDPMLFKKNANDLRQLVKVQILGCSYGLANPEKLVNFALKQVGVRITLPQAQKLIDTFQRTSPKVTNFWKLLMTKFKESSGEDMTFVLPSGRAINYFKCSRTDNSFAKLRSDTPAQRRRAWHGLLCENVTQAVARDCLAEALLRVDKAGHDIRWHVHDSIVCNVSGEEEAQEIDRLMRIAPEWAEDLPLSTEGTLSPHYRK